jgi:hypothetical protein
MWTQHERRSAQARALEERGSEYILPIIVAAAELLCMQPTTVYLNFSDHPEANFAGNHNFGLALLRIFGLPLLQFNSRRMDRCVGHRASCTGLDSGCFLSISCPLTPGIRLYGVEVDETGDTMDSKERLENQGFPISP